MSAVNEDPTLLDHDDDETPALIPNSSEPMGQPLPRDEHACSVSLPTWSSVVGYEEGDETVTSSMKCAYPRFMYHPLILQLAAHVVEEHGNKNGQKEDCLLLPGHAAAVRCQAFLQQALEGISSQDNALLCTDDDMDYDNTTADKKEPTNTSSSRIRIVAIGGGGAGNDANTNIHAVMFPAQTPAAMQAKAYWQHTGEIVSSRRAEHALISLGEVPERGVTSGPQAPYIWHPASSEGSSDSDDDDNDNSNDNTFTELRQRIAEWANVPSEESVFLTPSGMASIYTCLRSARRYRLLQNGSGSTAAAAGGRSIVYGFPYLDTLKLCSRKEFCPAGVDFFGFGNHQDLQLLEQVLESNANSGSGTSVLFTEAPSNPLLQCPDLYALRELADQYDFMLIVDDTIGNFLNIDMIRTGIADAVCTSLTKMVSGRGDAMAGSIATNPNTAKGRWMQQDLQREFNVNNNANSKNDTAHGLFHADARAILGNSQDFPERNQIINDTSEILADWLVDHPDVETVYYPKYSPFYASLIDDMRSRKSASANRFAGYGGLMSILLESHMCQRTFYDQLNVAKGPSLGTNFTLVCPYTLLAHYHELDFAMSYNVPPNLLRISVGLEDPSELKHKFEDAFAKSRLYPKLSSSSKTTVGSGAQARSYSTLAADGPKNVAGAMLRGRGGLLGRNGNHTTIKNLLRRFPR